MADEFYEPMVSVIIPVYNTEKYLVQCLESVIGQTYDNLEVICVDDDSKDNSIEILADYQRREKKIIIVRQPRTLGLSEGRNRGLDIARGKYVLFVDSDDYISADLVKKTVCCAEENNLDEVIFDYDVFTENDDWAWRCGNDIKTQENKVTHGGVKTGREILVETENARAVRAAWAALYNREFLKKNNLSFYNGILHEDVLFFFQRCMCAKRVIRLDEKLYHYRKNENTITTSYRGTRARSLFIVMSEVYDIWVKRKFDEAVNGAVESLMKSLWVLYNKGIFSGETETGEIKSNPAVDFFYRLTNDMELIYGKILNDDDIAMLMRCKKFLLFGCGTFATEVLLYLRKYNLVPDKIIVSNLDDNPRKFGGVEVGVIEDMSYESDVPIVMGILKGNTYSVVEKLSRCGYDNVVYINI